MSNSDDRLDALYKQLSADDNATSPAEIDERLRAAARASSAGTTKTVASPAATKATAATGTGWQQRYGWATAATLVLASAVFLRTLDTAPPSLAIPKPAPSAAAPPTLASEPVVPRAVVQQEQTALFEKRATRISKTVASATDSNGLAASTDQGFSTRRRVKITAEAELAPRVIAISQAPAQAPAQPRVQQRERMQSDQMAERSDNQVIEEVIVTGRSAKASNCEHYPNLLINRVCRNSAERFTLRANKTSRCAGLSYVIETTDGRPQPHSSSDSKHFVFDEEDGPVDQLVCKRGTLKLQSLARGR